MDKTKSPGRIGMDKSKKIYVKALEKYNKGYIDKAIELCEESISLNIKNTASINLKGLLFYLKGDLDTAQKLWKMNYQVNRDGVAERYLEDSKKDGERFNLYNKALRLIKELNINEALILLEKCRESDYNYINVNNYMSLCYMKKGQYNKALEHIENVIKTDVKNAMARESRKTLQDLNIINRKLDTRIVKYTSLALLCIFVVGGSFLFFYKHIKNNGQSKNKNTSTVTLGKFQWKDKGKENQSSSSPEKKKVDNTVSNKPAESKSSNSKKVEEVFTSDKIKNHISNKDFDSIYLEVMKWKDKNLSVNDKVVLSSAEELLKNEGSSYFYNIGCNYLSKKDYGNAKAYLLKSYEFGSKNDLYPHIVYMLGNSFDSLEDAENAIKYYSQYDQNFSSGEYEETVLYRLALIYKKVDIATAKRYAQKLTEKYPSSMYNNSIINNLINN